MTPFPKGLFWRCFSVFPTFIRRFPSFTLKLKVELTLGIRTQTRQKEDLHIQPVTLLLCFSCSFLMYFIIMNNTGGRRCRLFQFNHRIVDMKSLFFPLYFLLSFLFCFLQEEPLTDVPSSVLKAHNAASSSFSSSSSSSSVSQNRCGEPQLLKHQNTFGLQQKT